MASAKSSSRIYKGSGANSCSACHEKTSELYTHPLFQIPICRDCDYGYNFGDFDVIDGSEIFCRWCGQGEGELLLCDTCPKGFCSRCIGNNFGVGEVQRIKNLSDRWCCFVCSPQSFRDLCIKNNWKGMTQEAADNLAGRTRVQPGIVCYDITRGREKFEIPAVNTVDREPAPMRFLYVNKPVAAEGAKITNNPNFLTCCSCTDNCSNPATCECIINSGGQSYDHTGRLLVDKPAGIYECNVRCACNVQQCKNRVVSKGPSLRLEVFRCDNPEKGWGVRCRTPIPPGTFVADYLGEIMPESQADHRGLFLSDEYLYSLDCWGRSNACQRLHELGLKRSVESHSREYFVDSTQLTRAKLETVFDEEGDQAFLDKLEQHGVLKHMNKVGEQLRKDPWSMLLQAGGYCQEIGSKKKGATSQGAGRSGKSALGAKLANIAGVSSASKGSLGASAATSTTTGATEGAAARTVAPSATAKTSGKRSADASVGAVTWETEEITAESLKRQRLTWFNQRLVLRQKAWNDARALMVDRCVMNADNNDEQYIIDARWYGSVGRFLNHSCAPNVDKIMVYCESHDVHLPRSVFYSSIHEHVSMSFLPVLSLHVVLI